MTSHYHLLSGAAVHLKPEQSDLFADLPDAQQHFEHAQQQHLQDHPTHQPETEENALPTYSKTCVFNSPTGIPMDMLMLVECCDPDCLLAIN